MISFGLSTVWILWVLNGSSSGSWFFASSLLSCPQTVAVPHGQTFSQRLAASMSRLDPLILCAQPPFLSNTRPPADYGLICIHYIQKGTSWFSSSHTRSQQYQHFLVLSKSFLKIRDKSGVIRSLCWWMRMATPTLVSVINPGCRPFST